MGPAAGGFIQAPGGRAGPKLERDEFPAGYILAECSPRLRVSLTQIRTVLVSREITETSRAWAGPRGCSWPGQGIVRRCCILARPVGNTIQTRSCCPREVGAKFPGHPIFGHGATPQSHSLKNISAIKILNGFGLRATRSRVVLESYCPPVARECARLLDKTSLHCTDAESILGDHLQLQILRSVSHDPVQRASPVGHIPKQETLLSWPDSVQCCGKFLHCSSCGENTSGVRMDRRFVMRRWKVHAIFNNIPAVGIKIIVATKKDTA